MKKGTEMSYDTDKITGGSTPAQEEKESATDRRKEEKASAIINDGKQNEGKDGMDKESLPTQEENQSKTSEMTINNSDGEHAAQNKKEPEMSDHTDKITGGSKPAQQTKGLPTDERKEEKPSAIMNDGSKTTDIVEEACK